MYQTANQPSELSQGQSPLTAAQQATNTEVANLGFDFADYLYCQKNLSFILDVQGEAYCCGPHLGALVRLLHCLTDPSSIEDGRQQSAQQSKPSMPESIRPWLDRIYQLENVKIAVAWHVEGGREVHLEHRGYDNRETALRRLARVALEDVEDYVDFMLPTAN